MVVVLLWAIALGLGAYLIWHSQTNASSVESPTTSSAVAAASTTTSQPVTTTTQAPTTTTTVPDVLTVAAGGDVQGDRQVGNFLDKNGGEAIFTEVKPYMEPADLAFVNLEGPISDTGTRNGSKEYTFRSRPALLDGLVSTGINMVSLANNHSLDYRWAALKDCIARLDAADIAHAGAGGDFNEASAPTMIDAPAGTVALIAASEITVSFASSSTRAGTYYTSSPNKGLLKNVTETAKKVDFLIVSLHWGTEYSPNANSHQISLAHALVDAGADLVLGHHPHVIQALEIYNDRLIAYSLGDFVWDWHSAYAGEAFVLQVEVPRDGPPSGRVIPVFLNRSTGAPAIVTEDTADRILGRLKSLSAKRGLELTRDGPILTFGDPGPEWF